MAGIHRQPGQIAPERCQGALVVERADLLEQLVGAVDRGRRGRFEERERLDLAELPGLQPQDDLGQVAPLDFRLVNGRRAWKSSSE